MDTVDLAAAFETYAQVRAGLSAESDSSQDIAQGCVDGLADLWAAATVEMESTMQGELEGALAELTESDAELLVSVMVHMELAAQATE
jgi:hypothetical protein